MVDYILSVLYIIFFLVSLFIIGSTIFKNQKSLPIKLIYSYILYKFITSFGGIIVSLFELPFISFYIFMIILWIILLSLSFYIKYKFNIKIKKTELLENVKKYWFIFVISLVLLFFSMINIKYHWFGNHLDDGFYVNEVYDYVNNIDIYTTYPANGFNHSAKFDSYRLNTWQIESAFYSKLFRIEPLVLLKFGQNFINYFIFCILIVAFLEKMFSKETIEKYKYEIQFIPMVIILFIFQFDTLSRKIVLQDGWQFGNAMYYGSTIIRTMGIFLLLLPFIDKEKINFKDFLTYGLISFMLLAQSAVALPLVILVGLSYIISYIIFSEKKRKNIVLLIIILILILVFGIFLSNISKINNHALFLVKINKSSLIFYIVLSVFIMGFLYKNKIINKINTILLLMILFIYIPEINDITENLSMYDFVLARLWTGTFYTIMIIAFSYGYMFFCKKLHKKIFLVAKILTFLILVYGAYLSFKIENINIINSVQIIKENPKLTPNSTVILGDKLEKIYKKENKEMYVLTPDWVYTNNNFHSLAVLLRQQAKDIKVISAIPRYPFFVKDEFKSFSQKDNDIYSNYISDMNLKNYKEVKFMLDKYPINCLVSTKKFNDEFINETEYKYVDEYCDSNICYYIYFNKNK